jgi:hypothetical protein
VTQQSPLKISRAKIRTNFSTQKPILPIQSPSKETKEQEEGQENEHNKIITDIINQMLISKLSEADKLIERGLSLCREELAALSSGGTPTVLKERFKKDVRAYSTYRLTQKISLTVA